MEPGARDTVGTTPLKFTLEYIGLDVFYSVLTDALALPDASAFTVRNMWEALTGSGGLTFSNLRNKALTQDAKVREAIIRRLDTIEKTEIITDDPTEETKIEGTIG